MTDYHSDGEPCDEAVMSFVVAYSCPMSKATVHRILQDCICIETHSDQNAQHSVLPITELKGQWEANTQDFLKTQYDRLETNSTLRIVDDDLVDIETDAHTSKPAFMFAACMSILMHVAGKNITIIVPVQQMGIPGTSLSLRRALRCLLEESSSWSVEGLLQSMREVGASLDP